MPRIVRLDTPGLLNHVMIRGIERRKIFIDDKDRDNFIERLAMLLTETGTRCYAWSFLPNHAYRPFDETVDYRICRVLQQKTQSSWPAFPEPVQIHHLSGRRLSAGTGSIYSPEPVEAKLVSDLKALGCYAYCGHSALPGHQKREWQDVDYVLGLFAQPVGEARKVERTCNF